MSRGRLSICRPQYFCGIAEFSVFVVVVVVVVAVVGDSFGANAKFSNHSTKAFRGVF